MKKTRNGTAKKRTGKTIVIHIRFFLIPCTAKKAKTVSKSTVNIKIHIEKFILFLPKRKLRKFYCGADLTNRTDP